MKTNEIQIRDPFVYVENGLYYLYGTTDYDVWNAPGVGFDCYTGTDLENWTLIGNVFDKPAGYWGKKNFWAPEMHAYKGKYYLFASFKDNGVCRGAAILKADSPAGPFRPWSDGAVTPRDWECLDGTLFVENGTPYIVFCHEWVQVGNGEICIMPLTDDLSAPAGAPQTLFTAKEAKWAKEIHSSSGKAGYVTDGPNMHRCADGTLLMLWSTVSPWGYAIGYARSTTGTITGPWIQSDTPLFSKDGGHGMIFTDLKGRKILTIHSPNLSPNERAIFLELSDENGQLKLKRSFPDSK